jgi:hypothetical protein
MIATPNNYKANTGHIPVLAGQAVKAGLTQSSTLKTSGWARYGGMK